MKKINLMKFAAVCALVVSFVSSDAGAANVKLSNSGICHDVDSPWYNRTKKFTPHDSMETCLSQGRAYKGFKGRANTTVSKAPQGTRLSASTVGQGSLARIPPYDRALYGSWADEDGDCQNLRHELLISLSTGQVTLSNNGCRVVLGRWNDPYTGQIFTQSGDLDIDHLVPLAYAHIRGAYAWSPARKKEFYNDPVNLFAVSASANREKGAQGPLEWLPPDTRFRCSYITRFHRVMLTNKLTYLPGEKEKIDALRSSLCN